jgi:hypothetical protein
MQRKTQLEIQQILQDLGAYRDNEGTFVIYNAATEQMRYYWRPSFGWVIARAGPGRPAGMPNRLPRMVPPDDSPRNKKPFPYEMKIARSPVSGKKMGRPRKYFRGDGFDV